MTVNQYASRAGKKFESDLMKHLREKDYDVERLRLTGAEDEGDLLLRASEIIGNVPHRFVIEAKRRKGFNLAGWVAEARIERDNYADHRMLRRDDIGFVVVHYARGKNLSQSYVTTTLEEWLRQL